MFASILAVIAAPFQQWLKNRAEVAQAEHKREISVINNQARLAGDIETHNHQWEMASLNNKSAGLRYFSYAVFAMPIVVTVVSPANGKQIFDNLALVPDWWTHTFIAINGAVWGIIELKNAAPQLISAIRAAVKNG